MRKWCAAIAVAALLAFPLFGQQKDDSSNQPTTGTTASADAPAPVPDPAVHATHGVFALPAVPKKTPFPGPQAAAKTDKNSGDAPGQVVPRYELAGGYSYIDFNPGDPFSNFNNHGANGGFTYNATRFLGLTAELGGYHFKRDVNGNQLSGGLTSYLFGPRLNLRKFDHFVPFAEFLIGGVHGGGQVTGDSGQNTFALAAGGGVRVIFNKYVAWRFAQIDYLMTNFSGTNVKPTARQNNLRLRTGRVLRFGFPNPPPPPNHPPVAACSANPTSVFAGSNDAVTVHVNASDPDNDPLTYSYTASGGAVEGTGPDARFNTAGLAEGSYTVTAKVDDGKGGTATCAADITVAKKPNQPPTISCATD